MVRSFFETILTHAFQHKTEQPRTL